MGQSEQDPHYVHGSNVVNSGGIMIQETTFGYESSITRSLSTYDRLKSKGINRKIYTHRSRPPLHIFNRVGPRVLPSHLQLLTRHNGRRPSTNTVFGGSARGLVAVGSNLCITWRIHLSRGYYAIEEEYH